MLPNTAPTPMSPREVPYRGHTITLTHRPKTNDWQYVVRHTVEQVFTQAAPRFDAAVKLAKRDIDAALSGQRP